MTMVDYLARQARAIVTHFKYFEMLSNDIWKTYREEVKSNATVMEPTLATQCGSTWVTLLVGRDTSEMHDYGLYGADLVERLESIGLGEKSGYVTMMGEGGEGDFDEYRMEVYSEIGSYFSMVPGTSELAMSVRMQALRKVEWILHPHGMYHYQRPLPLLTPSLVVTIAEMLELVPDAVSEVSTCVLPRHLESKTRVAVYQVPADRVSDLRYFVPADRVSDLRCISCPRIEHPSCTMSVASDIHTAGRVFDVRCHYTCDGCTETI